MGRPSNRSQATGSDGVTIDYLSVEGRVRADIEAAKDRLIAILPRVDAMNSFLRSEAHRRHGLTCGGLHHVVYHYKREALKRATQLSLAEHRRAQVSVTCRDCGGAGKYTDQYDYTHPHCWACNSSGVAHLDFVETTISAAGIEWLSPRKTTWNIVSGFDALPITDRRWKVNQPGRDLTPSEVAAHLCAIEAFFPERPPKIYREYGEHDPGATYRIWIGGTPAGKCYLCGTPIERIYGGHVVISGRITWNGIICKTCENLSTESVSKRLEPMVPREFVTPEVAAWVASHPPSIASHAEAARPSRIVEVTHVGGDDDESIPF